MSIYHQYCRVFETKFLHEQDIRRFNLISQYLNIVESLRHKSNNIIDYVSTQQLLWDLLGTRYSIEKILAPKKNRSNLSRYPMTSILELGIAAGEKNRQCRMDSIGFHIINSTSKCQDLHIWRNLKTSLNFHQKLYQLDIQNNGNISNKRIHFSIHASVHGNMVCPSVKV